MSLISGSFLFPWLIPDHGKRYNLMQLGNLPVRTGHTWPCLPLLCCVVHASGQLCTQDRSGGTQQWPITRSPGDQDCKAHQPTHRHYILQYQLNQSLQWCSSRYGDVPVFTCCAVRPISQLAHNLGRGKCVICWAPQAPTPLSMLMDQSGLRTLSLETNVT